MSKLLQWPHHSELQQDLNQLVELSLSEDIGSGDISAMLIPDTQQVEATIITKEDAIFCGKPWAEAVFNAVDSSIEQQWLIDDGASLKAGDTILKLSGSARSLLSAERAALNFMQTLSATATQAHTFAQRLAETNVTLLDTRKTLPGFRLAQKYAVFCGGATNHRIALYDAFLIKENHIAAAGGISKAITAARQLDSSKTLEIEVETLEEFEQAISAKPDIIMLDNFDADMRATAFDLLDQFHKANPGTSIKIEISGNINIDNFPTDISQREVFVSSGAITKHIQAIDLSMRMRSS